jgi:formylglycine-generating enzyme required for sulfatase activity
VNDFYIGKYEVTVSQFKKFVTESGYRTEAERGQGCHRWTGVGVIWKVDENINWSNPGFLQTWENPVVCVSYNDAIEFVKWVSVRTQRIYRLPTEAEWEYAARSRGRKEKWPGTNTENEVGEYMWYGKNSGSSTHPVGKKKQNGLGIYDMGGNVSEWVQDWFDQKYYELSPKYDPGGPDTGKLRVRRGGSWFHNVAVRTSVRGAWVPSIGEYTTGFRLVLPKIK